MSIGFYSRVSQAYFASPRHESLCDEITMHEADHGCDVVMYVPKTSFVVTKNLRWLQSLGLHADIEVVERVDETGVSTSLVVTPKEPVGEPE